MTQKRYTRERLDGIAADPAAAKLKDAIPSSTLTCEYIHPDANAVIKGSEHGDTSETTARCNNVVQRGVPFPDRWKNALKSTQLHQTMHKAAEGVASLGISDIACELVGQAKRVSDESLGKVVALNVSGSRTLFLLCAKIENDEWFVQKGS